MHALIEHKSWVDISIEVQVHFLAIFIPGLRILKVMHLSQKHAVVYLYELQFFESMIFQF